MPPACSGSTSNGESAVASRHHLLLCATCNKGQLQAMLAPDSPATAQCSCVKLVMHDICLCQYSHSFCLVRMAVLQ